MPYIKIESKIALSEGKGAVSPGELNYRFTDLCKRYLFDKGESYQTYNDIVGALECAKLEIYRRKISFYEDTKITENGDVY